MISLLTFSWSESHTSYELSSLSENIIYEISLNFNGSMENFVILWYNRFNKYLGGHYENKQKF